MGVSQQVFSFCGPVLFGFRRSGGRTVGSTGAGAGEETAASAAGAAVAHGGEHSDEALAFGGVERAVLVAIGTLKEAAHLAGELDFVQLDETVAVLVEDLRDALEGDL